MAKKSSAPANETKSQKFVRLANARVNRVLRGLKHIGALGGGGYESTPDQRKRIETVLTEGLTRAIGQMAKTQSASQEFKL